MNEEDKLILGTLAGVDLILSPEHYEEYKGTLNKQLEEANNEIERLNNIINELGKDINNQLTMTRKFDEYNEGFFNATLHFYNKLKELEGDNNDKN